jgi:hypothetical protein
MALAFTSEIALGDAVQFGIHDGRQIIERASISAVPGF